ncbi:hypothetical protein FRX31_007003, partial [Thalictrum thalictroides]
MVKEGKTKQVSGVAELARRCLNLKGEMRTSMKEVAAELEWFRGSGSMSKNPQIRKESARVDYNHVDLYDISWTSYNNDVSSGQYSLETEM